MTHVGYRRVHFVETALTAARAIALTMAGALLASLLSLLYFQWLTGRWSLHTTLDLGGFLTVSSVFAVIVIGLPALVILRLIGVELRRTQAIVLALGIGIAAGVAVLSGFDGPRPSSLSGWMSIVWSPGIVPFAAAGRGFGYGAWIKRRSYPLRFHSAGTST